MLQIHASLHARPASVTAGPTVVLGGRPIATLAVRPEALSAPMRVSFEDAAAALEILPRMYLEPDGSFVWTGSAGDERWQLEGCLYDRAGRLLYVDLKGTCPVDSFDQLLRACGWPEVPMMFQLTREAVFVGEDEMRRWAE